MMRAPGHACTFGKRHGHVHWVRAPVVLDVKAGEDVVDARQGKKRLHLGRRNLVNIDAAPAVKGRDPAIFF